MAELKVYVAHKGNKVIAWSLENNLDNYLTNTVKVSYVKVDTNKFYMATPQERQGLVEQELKKKKQATQQVMTVGKLKEIISNRRMADDTPIVITINTTEDSCNTFAVTAYEDAFGNLELYTKHDYVCW